MSSGSESADAGKTQSKDETSKGSGGQTPGAGLGSTLGETPEERVGGAGKIRSETPESVAENVKITQTAFSGGTKPGNQGQTQTPAESETTDYGQTETKRSQE